MTLAGSVTVLAVAVILLGFTVISHLLMHIFGVYR